MRRAPPHPAFTYVQLTPGQPQADGGHYGRRYALHYGFSTTCGRSTLRPYTRDKKTERKSSNGKELLLNDKPHPLSLTRRGFNTGALAALAALGASGQSVESGDNIPWYRRTFRWG